MFGDKIAGATGDEIDKVVERLVDGCYQNQYVDQLKDFGFQPSAWYNDTEIDMMQAAHKQRQAIKQYELMKQQEHKEAEKLATAQAEHKRQQALVKMGWFDAVMKYDALNDDDKSAVLQVYTDQLDSIQSKIIKKKFALAKKLGISITATAIDEHQVFIDAVNRV